MSKATTARKTASRKAETKSEPSPVAMQTAANQNGASSILPEAIAKLTTEAENAFVALEAADAETNNRTLDLACIVVRAHDDLVKAKVNSFPAPAWQEMYKDDRTLSEAGKPFLSNLTSAFLGPMPKTADRNNLVAFQASEAARSKHNARISMLRRAFQVAVAYGATGGSAEMLAQDGGVMRMSLDAFKKPLPATTPATQQWKEWFGQSGFMAMDGGRFAFERLDASGKPVRYAGNRSVAQLIAIFWTKPEHLRQTPVPNVTGDDKSNAEQGPDQNRQDQWTKADRAKVLATADTNDLLVAAMANITGDKRTPLPAAYFNDHPKALDALRFWAGVYNRVQAAILSKQMDGDVKNPPPAQKKAA